MFGVGETVAGFEIDAVVGHGSSADVYRVHRTGESTPLALKVLHADDGDTGRARERFEREFGIASLLDHPHIVAMVSRGEVLVDSSPPRTQLWLAMQYVAGPSAMSLIPREDQQPRVPAVLRVAAQIGDALDYAHSREILHRDVKPANILLTSTSDDTDAVLSDFGIARLLDDTRPLARNGRVQGSIAYAAPELLQAQQLSPATDVYSFACSLVELFTGLPPFPRSTPFAITYAHLRDEPPKLTRRRDWLPSALNSVFAKALAKKPEERYQTCTEFVDIITRALRDVPVPAHNPRRRRRVRGYPG
ncbi:putative serine/threonine protein kinase [Gordonia polyisoprenivorans NBRC 16320 = JCM 10675]|uniref:non-specific serine/threonine protein kinase n=1 Tax=Gordonia polyisoprenivorans TaxID=84595 RepID=A0A846WSF5_9ACTN|nr:serine/threonine-protein kinase [Gordonia polyisoprenivorans]NKY04539.1 serine/threonine protein kinase [Gordonia polyisoprenivorans]OZC32511.1 serine/threonine protein kinase [Gordonia polyisoprenivorans]QUD83203.1 serine/threonine protein kinase [Gordonia polyisoprenivorans]UZF55926.1 serine/threonine protein kinase [Gordonia polyisoprenivorans]WCB37048.1 serine/threonine-protein kinase [Gordonia polyisoprenivorans]